MTPSLFVTVFMSLISCLLAGIEFCGRAASQLLTCWQDRAVFWRGAALVRSPHFSGALRATSLVERRCDLTRRSAQPWYSDRSRGRKSSPPALMRMRQCSVSTSSVTVWKPRTFRQNFQESFLSRGMLDEGSGNAENLSKALFCASVKTQKSYEICACERKKAPFRCAGITRSTSISHPSSMDGHQRALPITHMRATYSMRFG